MAERVPLIQVGTSGWHYPQGRGAWTRIVYPPPRARGGVDELTWYADRFHTVEVNASFYRDLSPDLTAKWVARTPPGFEFAVKLHQQFTHPRMHSPSTRDLAPVPEPSPAALASRWTRWRRCAKPGGSGHCSRSSRRVSRPPPRLWRTWPGSPARCEARRWPWSCDIGAGATRRRETLALLDAAGAAWVLIDEPKFRSSVWQSPAVFLEELRDRPWAYVRLHGRNAAQWWDHEVAEDRYNYLYPPEELEPFVDVADAAAALGKKLYLYANNHFAGNAVANAAQVRARLGRSGEGAVPADLPRALPASRGHRPGGRAVLDA